METSTNTDNYYCCDKKCFITPDEVDGIACPRCKCFNFCACKCATYQEEHKVPITRYCCPKKCFITPRTQVDGMACIRCESYCYCKCPCASYREKYMTPPTLEEFKFYRTRHFVTCCPAVCFKFRIEQLLEYCTFCAPSMFCECYLKKCINRLKPSEGDSDSQSVSST